jgi:hypothetical protein
MVKAWFRRCRRSVPSALTRDAAAPRSDAPSFEEKRAMGAASPPQLSSIVATIGNKDPFDLIQANGCEGS